MTDRYVKRFEPIREADTGPAEDPKMIESAYNQLATKYEAAKKQDQSDFQDYTDGKTNKDQYLSSFQKFLELEQQYRLAQVKYKIATARQEGGDDKKTQPGNKPGQTQQQPPPTPGTAPGANSTGVST